MILWQQKLSSPRAIVEAVSAVFKHAGLIHFPVKAVCWLCSLYPSQHERQTFVWWRNTIPTIAHTPHIWATGNFSKGTINQVSHLDKNQAGKTTTTEQRCEVCTSCGSFLPARGSLDLKICPDRFWYEEFTGHNYYPYRIVSSPFVIKEEYDRLRDFELNTKLLRPYSRIGWGAKAK